MARMLLHLLYIRLRFMTIVVTHSDGVLHSTRHSGHFGFSSYLLCVMEQ
jgi:hypothetical protein